MSESGWLFRLYIAGETPLGQRALANLEAVVDRHLPDRAEIEVVDLKENPEVAVSARILAVPTVVRERPTPEVRLIGDLSDPAEVIRVMALPVASRPGQRD